jgi:hypothetical protein
MRLFKILAALAISVATSITLTGCPQTSNGSNDATAATPASYCTTNAAGQSVDQYGRVCSNYASGTGNCVGATYNPATGTYINTATGQVVSCNPSGYFDGYNSVPYSGLYQGNTFTGCQGWSQVYPGVQYVPVDIGNGQMVCMNYAYLGSAYPNLYQQPASYYYSQPIYTCGGADCYGYGYGNAGGAYYGCSTSVAIGFSYGDVSAGGGFCSN